MASKPASQSPPGRSEPMLAALQRLVAGQASLEDLVRARAAYERALAIFDKSLPPEHLHIRIVRENLENLVEGSEQ